jgi:putative endonuclease
MNFNVYAISSIDRNYIYVGLSSNLQQRLTTHNNGLNKTTKPYAPFNLIYSKTFDTRPLARQHEKYLKSGAGKEFLKSLI